MVSTFLRRIALRLVNIITKSGGLSASKTLPFMVRCLHAGGKKCLLHPFDDIFLIKVIDENFHAE